jgi:hypothetical protein
MAKKKAPPRKWQLQAWPPGPRFSGGRQTAVFRRDYASEAAANRAASPVRRLHPGTRGEITIFEQEIGFFWMARTTVVKWDDTKEASS